MMKKTLAAVAGFAAVAATLSTLQPSRAVNAMPVADAESRSIQQGTATIRYVTSPTGNAARYRIREQLVGLDLPNDAVGETNGVTGVIVADARGNVLAAQSRFTVDVSALKSDRDRRDNFVRRRVLETEQYPNVVFVPKSVRGVPLPLPTSGTRTFDIVGDMTVKGTTKPTIWKVTAEFHPDRMTGAATTSFTFADFGIEQPRVPVVLSVDETIKLEFDFTLVPAP